MMPSPRILAVLFWLSIGISVISFFLISLSEQTVFCFRSDCFDIFLDRYKFPIGFGGISIALWTLELSTRRAEQMAQGLILDRHYRRLEYFKTAMERQVDLTKSRNTINYFRFYIWLYPNSIHGDFRFGDDVESLICRVTLLAEKTLKFIDVYVDSNWFPYMGAIPDYFEEIDFLPARCGITTLAKPASPYMKSYNDSLIRVAIDEIKAIDAIMDCVLEIDEASGSEAIELHNELDAMKIALAKLGDAWLKIQQARSEIAENITYIKKRSNFSVGRLDRAGIDSLAGHVAQAKFENNLRDYAVVYIAQELSKSDTLSGMDRLDLEKDIVGKTGIKPEYFDTRYKNSEFTQWAAKELSKDYK